MGACTSKVNEWREEAENDEEVTRQEKPPAGAVAQPSPPQLPFQRAPSEAGSEQWAFRKSQEFSMAHLVRHPRLEPFQAIGGQFGLAAAYQPVKLLGRGGTGQTWLCREAATGTLYAVKLQQRPIPRATVRLSYNEITIQASTCATSVHMSHIKEVLLTPSHLALVLDYEAGGSAAEFVAQQIPKVGRLDLVVDEDYARFMFRQLVAGLAHLHEHFVAHRDVKLDNTLLDAPGGGGQAVPLPTVKLCDFQFAKQYQPRLKRTKTHLGTAVYMAPELIENRQSKSPYDPVEVDVWAAGIWLVALLCGAFPFDNRPGADDTAAEMQILRQEVSGSWAQSKFVRPYIAQLSPEAVDLLSRILHVDPTQRISLDQIQEHPWMRRPLPPRLEAGWQRIRQAQLALERQLSAIRPDPDQVHQRNGHVFDLVREAAAPPDHWEASYQRMTQACRGSRLVNCSSLPGTVRIDMRPLAVAQQLSDRALSLLDSPPSTPQRVSMPLHTIASDVDLAGMAAGNQPQPLAPSPAAPLPTSSRGAPSSTGGGSLAGGSSSEDLRQLSPFAATGPIPAP